MSSETLEPVGDEQQEQLSGSLPAPRSERRESDHPVLVSRDRKPWTRHRQLGFGSERVQADVTAHPPPHNLAEHWTNYFWEFPLTQAPLKLFDYLVVEPGYQIRCEAADGERDEEMEDALEFWASSCVIHAGEKGHDLKHLLAQIPSKRRGKPAVFLEKVGTRDDPDSLSFLMMLPPETITIYTRKDQPIVVQPNDDVGEGHLTTDAGDPAAYVQYDQDHTSFETDPIPFSDDDIVKFVWNPDEGEVWGGVLWTALAPLIDGVIQTLRDREHSIRMAGYPHRIYNSDSWTKDQAKKFANAHENREYSAWDLPEEREKESYAGRVDYVSHDVNVQVESGEVPDLEQTIRDYIEQIFSLMPVGKYRIAYADDINQFVVEPQEKTDERYIQEERGYLEEKFEPVFEEKADELAGGSYDGDVHFSIEPPKEENPLRREDFPGEALQKFADAWETYMSSDGGYMIPPEAFADLAGIDLSDIQETYEHDVDALEISPDGEDADAPPGEDGDATGDDEDEGDEASEGGDNADS